MLPPRLTSGSHLRIIAPSCTRPSVSWMTDAMLESAKQYFTDRGISVSEGKHIHEINEFGSTTIEHRLADLHDAFRDPSVTGIICLRGGWNVNQLLPFIDYDLIKKNPKILCGFSDITALGNAIYAKTGCITYSGPNFTHFFPRKEIQYTYDHFLKAVMTVEPIELESATMWTDRYYEHGTPWNFEKNEGWWVVHEGKAEGTSIGGNLCTLSLLQGTDYMPCPTETILFVEDDHETHPRTFDRDLASLTQQPWFKTVRGILIGRMQRDAVNTEFGPVTKEMLLGIIANNATLKNIPIIANVDFGHTHPIFTFPIGGRVKMSAVQGKARIGIVKH